MSTLTNQEVKADTTNSDGEAKNTEGGDEVVTIPKKDYEKMNQDIGSFKRELKDLKNKPKEEAKETPKSNQTDEIGLLKEKMEKQALRHAGLTHQDDMELARTTAKKWNMDVEDVLLDDDFKVKLERQQTGRANVEATSGVKGNPGSSQAKNTAEYWIAKGTPPTAADIPDRKTRQAITRKMFNAQKGGDDKKFYND